MLFFKERTILDFIFVTEAMVLPLQRHWLDSVHRPGLYSSNKVCDSVKLKEKSCWLPLPCYGCSHSLCICPLIMWSPQRWQTECSAGDGELLQAFGNLHHRQRSILWHLNCFKREGCLILLMALCHSVTFLKKRKKKTKTFAFLNKVQIYRCKGFHWFSFTVTYMLVFKRATVGMYGILNPPLEPWKPALAAWSSRRQHTVPSPRCLLLRHCWYGQWWLPVRW